MLLAEFLKMDFDPRERVQIFIDGSNLYHGLKNECRNTKLDYSRFAALLANGHKLIRINYYTATRDSQRDRDGARSQQKFMDALRHIPYVTVKHRPLKYRNNIPLEKGVDVLIATDMLTSALRDCHDTAVLVSGDGDFVEVLDEIKRAGKQVENATFQSSRSDALINASDLFIQLNKDDLADCLLMCLGGTTV